MYVYLPKLLVGSFPFILRSAAFSKKSRSLTPHYRQI